MKKALLTSTLFLYGSIVLADQPVTPNDGAGVQGDNWGAWLSPIDDLESEIIEPTAEITNEADSVNRLNELDGSSLKDFDQSEAQFHNVAPNAFHLGVEEIELLRELGLIELINDDVSLESGNIPGSIQNQIIGTTVTEETTGTNTSSEISVSVEVSGHGYAEGSTEIIFDSESGTEQLELNEGNLSIEIQKHFPESIENFETINPDSELEFHVDSDAYQMLEQSEYHFNGHETEIILDGDHSEIIEQIESFFPEFISEESIVIEGEDIQDLNNIIDNQVDIEVDSNDFNLQDHSEFFDSQTDFETFERFFDTEDQLPIE